ncbi:beta-lactamase, partial [Escherichia coli TW00353]
MAGRFVWKP